MRARILSFYPPLALLLACLIVQPASADFQCSSELSYKWVKGSVGGGAQASSSQGTQGARSPQASPVPSGQVASEPSLVRLVGVARVGVDETSAKGSLQVELNRQRVRASETCKRDHESFGTCVAMKLSSNSSILNSLGFNARADLEKALSEECRQQQGTCLEVTTSEPICREIGEPKPTPPPPAPEKKPASKKK